MEEQKPVDIILDARKECPITHVIVLQGGALVTRRVSFELPKSEEEGEEAKKQYFRVMLMHMSRNLRDDSLKILRGTKRTEIEDVIAREMDSEEMGRDLESAGELTKLVECLKAKKHEKDILELEIKSLKAARAAKCGVIRSCSAAELPFGFDFSPEAFAAAERLLEMHAKEQIAGIDELLHKEEQLEKVNMEIWELEKKHENYVTLMADQLKAPADKCVILMVRGQGKSGKMAMDLEYVVSDAEWIPRYRINVDNENSKADLLYTAQLENNSREPWPKTAHIDVAFSVMDALGLSAPGDIPDVYLRLVTETTVESRMQEVITSDDIIHEYQGGNSLVLPVYPSISAIPKVFASDRGSDDRSQKKRRRKSSKALIGSGIDIPCNNGVKYTVGIKYFTDLPVSFLRTVLPRFASAAYLSATVSNKTEIPICTGVCHVFFKNNFVCQTTVSPKISRADFILHLGFDPAVVVRARPPEKVGEATAFFRKVQKKKTDVMRGYMHIENWNSEPVNIVVKDAFPRTRTEEISVTMVSEKEEAANCKRKLMIEDRPESDKKSGKQSKSSKKSEENVDEGPAKKGGLFSFLKNRGHTSKEESKGPEFHPLNRTLDDSQMLVTWETSLLPYEEVTLQPQISITYPKSQYLCIEDPRLKD